MGALAHYLEDEGLATTQISLVRLHTEKMRPPRALWVPFELGRPLGAPADAAFQRRVLMAALGLLAAPEGPVLEDFPDDEPEAPPGAEGEEGEGLFCPVSFDVPADDTPDPGGFRRPVAAEIAGLAPWYDLAVERNGRTTVGASGLGAEEAARFINAVAGGETVESPIAGLTPGQAIRLIVEDLKAFYMEAASAQPGRASAREMAEWFWGTTAAARMLLALPAACAGSADESLREVTNSSALVPRSQRWRLE